MYKKTILFLIPFLFFLASLLSLFPFWLGDLFSHFRMFWVVLSIIFIVAYFFLSKEKIYQNGFAFSFFALLINIYGSFSFWTNFQTYSYLFSSVPTSVEYSEKVKQEIENDTTVKTLLLMNILSSNNDYLEADALINKVDADFVVIIELNKKWESEFYWLKQNYSYKFNEVREDNFGMGIYSKTSFTDSDIILNDKGLKELNKELDDNLKRWDSKVDLDISKVNVIQAIEPSIFVKNKTGLNIVVAHPIPPISLQAYRERNGYLNQKMEFIKQKTNQKILLVGDFNCSPFSADYKKFLKKSGLKDSQKNFGFQPTWHTSLPFLMQIPIDHVWHSEDIEILHRQTLPIKGSDHKAAFVVFR